MLVSFNIPVVNECIPQLILGYKALILLSHLKKKKER
jgi:hypothetical protein